jgi:murein L,D-transpeptidase YcbB/YkuD
VKRRWLAIGGAIIAMALFAAWRFYGQGTGRGTGLVSRRIESDIQRRDMPDDAPWRDRRTQSLVRAFYAKRRMRPAWTSGAGALNQAHDLAEVLKRADQEGLNPDDYSATELAAHGEENKSHLLAPGDPQALAEFDLLCTIAAFHYMSDVYDGRISPKSLDAEWVATPRRGDFDSLLTEALERDRVQETLLRLAPTQDGYRKLRGARARYAKIVAAGGWPSIPAGAPLRRGQRGPRVQALRSRLIISADLDSAAGAAGVFDEALEAAVRRYQVRYGREPDGVLRETELADLNVSATYRLGQIELNMERWRWAPRSFDDRHLIVNIPEYALHIFERGKSVLDMRVVVGKALTATPIFSDLMTQVVINPTWSVPVSIAQNEFAPAVRQDRDYLAKNHIRIFDGEADDAKEVPASSVNWSDTSEVRRLHFRQDAGEANALGRIKFLLPNRFDVYLHDTPAGQLFSLEERSFSHGCVRVEDPIGLARYVLRGLPEAAPGEIEKRIESGTTTTLDLPDPLPVHILYFTAFVEEKGAVGFREDVYGIDQNLIEELRSRSHARAQQ